MGKTGPFQIRPFQLPCRQDYGLRGTSDHVFWLQTNRNFMICFDGITPIIFTLNRSYQCPILKFSQDLQKQLCQLILLNGFATCPDTPGGEKLCVAHLERSWLKSPPSNIKVDTDLDMDPTTLPPNALFMVKGWNRAVCCLGILYSAWTNEELFQAGFSSCLVFILPQS